MHHYAPDFFRRTLSPAHGQPHLKLRQKKYVALRIITSLLLLIATLSQIQNSWAQEAKRFGDYELHYNAFHSIDVSAKAIRAHKLKRGPKVGMLNISLLKYDDSGKTTAERATVVVESQNLVGQIKNLEVTPIVEPGALYYIAQFRYANEETFRFKIFVTPENNPEKTFEVAFKQKFYQVNP